MLIVLLGKTDYRTGFTTLTAAFDNQRFAIFFLFPLTKYIFYFSLFRKIEKLESKLILVYKDKYDVISDKNYIENENQNLKEELENENNKNEKLTNINSEYEKTINKLKIDNKNIKDKSNFQVQYMNNELNGWKPWQYPIAWRHDPRPWRRSAR